MATGNEDDDDDDDDNDDGTTTTMMTTTMMVTADWRWDTTTMAMTMVAARWAMGYTDDGYGEQRQCSRAEVVQQWIRQSNEINKKSPMRVTLFRESDLSSFRMMILTKREPQK